MNCLRRNPVWLRNVCVYPRNGNGHLLCKKTSHSVSNSLQPSTNLNFDCKIISYRFNRSRFRLGLTNYLAGYSNRYTCQYEMHYQSPVSMQFSQFSTSVPSLLPRSLPSSTTRISYATNANTDSSTETKTAMDVERKSFFSSITTRFLSSSPASGKEVELGEKLSLFQKFKKMYRDYWYVLIPVHCATSICWFGGFYVAAKSGVDLVAIMEFLNLSESLVGQLKSVLNGHAKQAGIFAVAFALYKIATPLRYAVTLGGTTLAINYLKKFGYIKPIPRKDELKQMYQVRKDILIEKRLRLKKNVLDHFKEAEVRKSAGGKSLSKKDIK